MQRYVYLIAEREEVFSRVYEHDRNEGALDSFAFGRPEEDIIQSVFTAGGEDKQVVLEVTLAFRGLLNEFETVLTRQTYFVRDRFLAFLANRFDMGDDTVDILFCMAAVVVGLQEDDMRACFAGEVGTNLCFVGFFFEHGYRDEQSSQGLNGHGIGHENVRTSFFATFVEVLLNSALIVRTFNEFDIFVIIPNHSQCIVSIVCRYCLAAAEWLV